jgi:hypothetical protein
MRNSKINTTTHSQADAGQLDEVARLIDAIQDLDVAERVAGNIVAHYERAYLWKKVRQTRYARRVGVASNPAGWFVSSVRNNWKPPAGFDEWAEMAPEEYREALFKSWGVCRRCWSRPCRCKSGGNAEEVGHGKLE